MCKTTTRPFEIPPRDTFQKYHLPIAWSANINKQKVLLEENELDSTRRSINSTPISKANVRHRRVRFAIYPQVYFFEKVPSEDRSNIWYSLEKELVMYHTFLEEKGYLMEDEESSQIEYIIDDSDSWNASPTTIYSKCLQKTEPSIMGSYVIPSLHCLLMVYALLAGLELTAVISDMPKEEGMEVLMNGGVVMNVTGIRES